MRLKQLTDSALCLSSWPVVAGEANPSDLTWRDLSRGKEKGEKRRLFNTQHSQESPLSALTLFDTKYNFTRNFAHDTRCELCVNFYLASRVPVKREIKEKCK